MNNSFDIFLPSNTAIEGNLPHSYRVRLPKKLEFNSEWLVGLSVINYPHTWPTTGTHTVQFIEIKWWDEQTTRVELPSFNVVDPIALQKLITNCLDTFSEKYHVLAADENNVSDEMEWFARLSHVSLHLKCIFDETTRRFTFDLNPGYIKNVTFSKILSYILGFESHVQSRHLSTASFSPNLMHGIPLLYIYTPGLIEPVAVGNISAPLLRVVNVSGSPGELTECIYDTVQYRRLLVKEICEICVEIRTPTGELVPFEHGSCLLTLNFRKNF